MARIRTIKPTFWTDEKLGELPRDVRLLFLGLVSAMADDQGRFKASARLVRAAVFPFDDDVSVADVERWLAALADARRVVLYVVEGERYATIPHFLRHQKIDRPSASNLPEPSPNGGDHSTNVRRSLDEPSASPRPVVGEESKGEELEQDQQPVALACDVAAADSGVPPAAVSPVPAPPADPASAHEGEEAADPEPPPPPPEWRDWVEPGVRLNAEEVGIVRRYRELYPRRGVVDKATARQLRKALTAWRVPPSRVVAALEGNHDDDWCRTTRNQGLAYVLRDTANLEKYAEKAADAAEPATDADGNLTAAGLRLLAQPLSPSRNGTHNGAGAGYRVPA